MDLVEEHTKERDAFQQTLQQTHKSRLREYSKGESTRKKENTLYIKQLLRENSVSKKQAQQQAKDNLEVNYKQFLHQIQDELTFNEQRLIQQQNGQLEKLRFQQKSKLTQKAQDLWQKDIHQLQTSTDSLYQVYSVMINKHSINKTKSGNPKVVQTSKATSHRKTTRRKRKH